MAKDVVIRFHVAGDPKLRDVETFAEALADREHLNLASVHIEDCPPDEGVKHGNESKRQREESRTEARS